MDTPPCFLHECRAQGVHDIMPHGGTPPGRRLASREKLLIEHRSDFDIPLRRWNPAEATPVMIGPPKQLDGLVPLSTRWPAGHSAISDPLCRLLTQPGESIRSHCGSATA